MHNMKKIQTMVLAILLVLGIAAFAFAGETNQGGTITANVSGTCTMASAGNASMTFQAGNSAEAQINIPVTCSNGLAYTLKAMDCGLYASGPFRRMRTAAQPYVFVDYKVYKGPGSTNGEISCPAQGQHTIFSGTGGGVQQIHNVFVVVTGSATHGVGTLTDTLNWSVEW